MYTLPTKQYRIKTKITRLTPNLMMLKTYTIFELKSYTWLTILLHNN